ncbi:MAG: peptide deformylase [Myxococcota bacterium]
MATLDIIIFPDDRLRKAARKVERFDEELKEFVENLAETMYADDGLGLAAPQVGDDRRIFVIDDSVIKGEDAQPNLIVFINPRVKLLGEKITWKEGCLSFPGETVETERYSRVEVEALDLEGRPFSLSADVEKDGILAIAIQHENDHLEGRLIIDFLSPLNRHLMKKRLIKHKKEFQVSETEGKVVGKGVE